MILFGNTVYDILLHYYFYVWQDFILVFHILKYFSFGKVQGPIFSLGTSLAYHRMAEFRLQFVSSLGASAGSMILMSFSVNAWYFSWSARLIMPLPLWSRLTCSAPVVLSLNTFEHREHRKGLKSACTRACRSAWPLVVNLASHCLHWALMIFRCTISRCFSKVVALPNDFPHSSHILFAYGHLGSSRCCLSSSSVSKVRSQLTQLNLLLSPWAFRMCRFIWFLCPARNPHWSQTTEFCMGVIRSALHFFRCTNISP